MNLLSAFSAISVIISIFLFGYTSYWYIAADQIEKEIIKEQKNQSLKGRALSFDKMSITGFPFRFETLFQSPKIRIPNSGLKIESRKLVFSMKPWDYTHISIAPDNITSIEHQKNGITNLYNTGINSGNIKISLKNNKVNIVDIKLSQLNFKSPFTREPASINELYAQIDLSGIGQFSSLNTETIKLHLNINKIGIPDDFGAEMGKYVEYFQFSADLFGPISGDKIKDKIINWRDSGGIIELETLKGRWGPLEIDANGTLAIDNEMRPLAALTSNVAGYSDMIDSLIMSNAIPFGDAFLAKVAFNMLAEEREDGGPRVLENVPLTIQDGLLSIGPMELGKVKPIKF
ncbi:MAG: hypothetical protein CMM30_08425 [Rhodospirillaceae bacterium]|nr:hypothetical protein [Rhodospirillaceae bacterium]|tara:strand:+ start:1562 stop:2599 length:1038 start_codon:yes stop_codon:yes gene_type:complete